MDTALEIQEIAKYLDEDKKMLILQVMKNFLPDGDEMPYDKYYLDLAEKELESGDTGSWDNILAQ
jgi:hypothetical protein